MIDIKNKVDCCGCQACGDICNKKAIRFQTDEEGIWYPVVDMEKCVDCGLCDKVCPIINRTSCPTNAPQPECYVLQAPNSFDRLQSASGAAYTLIARKVFEMGGIVAGHVWDGQFGVKSYISGNADDLNILRGTKYLQSNVDGVYVAVRQLLKEGKFVLFSGTPCQNAAMRSFLRKDYDNLIITDFVCMGIDSPLAFKKYLDSLESQYNSKIVYFKAKSKEVGWRYLTNKAVFANGKTYFGINGRDANLNATFLDVLVRPSCYDCKFKGFPRVSDMTIGDYWRRKYDYDPLDDNTGTSYVMLHNDKAKRLFEQIKDVCIHRVIDFDEILTANKFAVTSLPKPIIDRGEFYKRLQNEDFSQLVSYYVGQKKTRRSYLGRMKSLIRQFMAIVYYYRRYPVSLLRFIHYNFFSTHVMADFCRGDIFVVRNTKLSLSSGAVIKVKGTCIVDSKDVQTRITMGHNSSLLLDNNSIGGGSNINIENNASISLGFKTIVKHSVKMNARTSLRVGEFSVVSDDVCIDDTNQGITYFNEINKADRSINIGTHVLLNKGCLVNGGASIEDESIVRDYSVVNSSFEPRVVLAGNPATIVDKDINWKHNFDFIWNYKS